MKKKNLSIAFIDHSFEDSQQISVYENKYSSSIIGWILLLYAI